MYQFRPDAKLRDTIKKNRRLPVLLLFILFTTFDWVAKAKSIVILFHYLIFTLIQLSLFDISSRILAAFS